VAYGLLVGTKSGDLLTSNDLERHNRAVLRYFTEFGSFGAIYIKQSTSIAPCMVYKPL